MRKSAKRRRQQQQSRNSLSLEDKRNLARYSLENKKSVPLLSAARVATRTMSNAMAKITRQSTGPEMTDYLENEIYNLCESIQDNGQPVKSGTGLAQIRFIELFKLHSVVSNRLANMLSRARKNGYISFKSEILMQGKDDNEIITLLKMPPHVHQITKTQMIKKK